MEQVRLFIAIELDDALRAALKRAQTRLQDDKTRDIVAREIVRWVAPQNIHLTLKFLGNAKALQVDELRRALERVARDSAPLHFTARGLGCFPNTRRPNNVWIGLEGDLERAALLVQRIDDECAALGFAREPRGFTPHLTLGRVKREASSSQRAALGEWIKNFPRETYGEIRADSIALIASDLQPRGPVYTILSASPLGEMKTR